MTPTPSSPLRPRIRTLLLLTAFLLPLVVSVWTWERTEMPRLTLLKAVTLLGYLLWVCQPNFRMPTIRASRLLLPLALCAAVSTALSVHLRQSFVELLSLATYLAYFYLVYAAARDLRFTRYLMTALLASAAIMSFYGIGQHWGFDPLHWRVSSAELMRVFSTFGNRIYMAAYFAMLLPLALAAVVTARRRLTRGVGLAAFLLMCACLFFGTGRAGMAAAVLAGLAFAALCRRSGVPEAFRRCVLCLGAAALLWAGIQWMDHLAGKPSALSVATKGESAVERWQMWRASVRMMACDPVSSASPSGLRRFLRVALGWGPGTYDLMQPRFTDVNHLGLQTPTFGVPLATPHNDLLLIGATMGLAGLALWIRLLWGMGAVACQVLRRIRGEETLLVGAWAASGAAYVVQSLLTPPVVGTQFLLWTCLGVLSAAAARAVPGYSQERPEEAQTSSVPLWGRRALAGAIVAALVMPGNLARLPAAIGTRQVDTRFLPSLAVPLVGDHHLRRALDLRLAGHYDEAFREHQAAIDHDPLRKVLWLSCIDTCKLAARKQPEHWRSWLAAAQRCGSYLTHLDPRDGLAHMELANVLFLGDQLSVRYPRPVSRVAGGSQRQEPGASGMAAPSQEWVRAAEREYRQAAALWTRVSAPHHGMARCLQAQGRLKEAEREYLRAIELGSSWGEPEANLGWLYYRRGLTRPAIYCLELATSRVPTSSTYRRRYQALLDRMRAGVPASELLQRHS